MWKLSANEWKNTGGNELFYVDQMKINIAKVNDVMYPKCYAWKLIELFFTFIKNKEENFG